MQLTGTDGQGFCLRIVGYQFPKQETAEYDSNWLVVECKVFHPSGQWQFRDPCLLTYEASHLADWLELVARDKIVPPSEESFIEGNISFRLDGSPDDARLRVYFEQESRPAWAASKSDLWVEFRCSEIDLRLAAKSIREQLALYPQRAQY
jgi:hypothetical protein